MSASSPADGRGTMNTKRSGPIASGTMTRLTPGTARPCANALNPCCAFCTPMEETRRLNTVFLSTPHGKSYSVMSCTSRTSGLGARSMGISGRGAAAADCVDSRVIFLPERISIATIDGATNAGCRSVGS